MLLRALMVIKSHVRLFVTSRPLHVSIMRDLSGLPFISMDNMEGELLTDIRLHVTRELDARHRLRDLDAVFKAEICSVLCAKACGMYGPLIGTEMQILILSLPKVSMGSMFHRHS